MLFDSARLQGDIKNLPAEFHTVGQDCYCWSDGYCFKGDVPCLGEQLSAEILERAGRKDLAGVNGCYISVIVKEQDNTLTISLISDRYGTRPLYYSAADDRFLISDDYWAVADSLRQCELSAEAAIEYMVFSYVLCENTIVKQIKEVTSAAVVTFEYDLKARRVRRVTHDSYWRYDIKPEKVTKKDLVDGLCSVYKAMSVRYGRLLRAMGVGQVGINLSAGKDSRLIAWMLRSQGFVPRFYTNRSVNQDLVTALKISQLLEAPHTVTSLWHLFRDEPDDDIFWKLCPTTMFTVSNNAISLRASGCLRDDAIISGHLGDFFSGGHLPLQGVLKASRISRDEVGDIAARRNIAVSAATLEPVIKPRFSHMLASSCGKYADLIRNAQVTFDLGALTQVDLEQRQRRLLFRDVTTLNCLGVSLMPFADMEYSAFFSRVQFEWMLYSRLVMTAMADQLSRGPDGALFRIPVNGRVPSSSRHPLFDGVIEHVMDSAGSRLRKLLHPATSDKERKGAVSDRNYVKVDILLKNIEYLDWLVDIDALKKHINMNQKNSHFILFQFWVLYSLAMISKRLT